MEKVPDEAEMSIGATLKRIPSLYFPLPQVMRARGKPSVQREPQLLVRSIPESSIDTAGRLHYLPNV